MGIKMDSLQNEKLAGFWHAMFAILYTGAGLFHVLSTIVHFRRVGHCHCTDKIE